VQSRRVGDITVIQCSGRIVEGPETAALRHQLDSLSAQDPYIVLDLGDVQFIDSSGLGLLVRFLTRSRARGGRLTLCSVPHRVDEALKISGLRAIFESHDTEAAAIAAFYQSAPSGRAAVRVSTDALCVDASPDIQVYVREVLGQAGYGVLTSGNLADALILLQAAQPKVVIVSAELRSSRNTRAAEMFNRLTEAGAVVELPAEFSRADAGDAARRLLDEVGRLIGRGTNA
jgi:anti-sigma B factor antagonist